MERILIFDTSAIIYRNHYAMPYLINSKGQHTGALMGLVKTMDSYIKEIEPTYIACAMDTKRSNLKRTEIFEEYKSKRKSMPEELVSQLEYITKILEAYNISSFKSDDHEADDVISSLCEICKNNNIEVHIVTGDKDLQQLVDSSNLVYIHVLGKDLVINTREGVKENFGIYPEQIPDFFGLKGDASDGIPGVAGIGDKKGIALISEYTNLENIYANIDKIKGALQKNLIENKELAFISRELATVNRDLKLNISMEDIKYREKNIDKLISIFEELEFQVFLKSLKESKSNTVLEYIEIAEEEAYSILKDRKVCIYEDDFVYIADDKKVYYTKSIDYSKIKSSYYILFDAKQYLHKGLILENNFFDVLIAAFVIKTSKSMEIEDIVEHYEGISLKKYTNTELKKADIEELHTKRVKIVRALYSLEEKLKSKLKEIDIKDTYTNIEKPLIKVLYNMEKKGIEISKEKFKKLHEEFTRRLAESCNAIFELANEEFNIDSPAQLGVILFEKMGIEPIKKTKRGYSTDIEVLEILKSKGYKIAEHLINYRAMKKLLSTYVESLPSYADENNRIHSSFNGTGALTGRLSSSNPNLQNIPTRTKEGNDIRACFIAGKNKKLLSVDYSQIELRVLAHLSKDESLLNAYKNNLDLHSLTACELFNKELLEINKEERNIAKVINFSVLYGKTAYGLSQELKIPFEDARLYIKKYFNKYPKVKEFLNNVVEEAKKHNYVETLFGTRRYIEGINSSNSFVQEEAKRVAVNTVVQGTAANIIKLVMLELDKKNYPMLLQVHDELIFEIDESESKEVANDIVNIMENTITFDDVKLQVNYGIADSWGELK